MTIQIKITNPDAKDVLVWTKDIDDKSLSQLDNIARLPFIYRHVAAMPDVHAGTGATIGSVIATQGAVIPAAVGVDIGCGMLAVPTNLNADDIGKGELEAVMKAIVRRTPVGMSQHDEEGTHYDLCKPFEAPLKDLLEREPTLLKRMTKMTWQGQLGTLGSGNHFIELEVDTSNQVWIMLHSGSRGAGLRHGKPSDHA